jgi:hypothetical protein
MLDLESGQPSAGLYAMVHLLDNKASFVLQGHSVGERLPVLWSNAFSTPLTKSN